MSNEFPELSPPFSAESVNHGLKFTLPIGEMRCAECGREPAEGEDYRLILYAGSAWKDGVAVVEDKAELYYAKLFCEEHAPSEGATDPARGES